ncbi:carboxymuconolactone decarboxylase family protein [Actinomadura rayongensis]|uniref:Carboxymuconolactone decarboxylase family protein n=1 Tax=Actinomadura rayongensis TaxID=1429076 RepID=A0A6I4W2S4_9ACTN|nr:carboxymuconolactone decarboxylase family protein [Actinomadura rayongensis]MXQ63751.1 carboxymuconolactone decarboxylase family protein [Actinomadura rayongensis]
MGRRLDFGHAAGDVYRAFIQADRALCEGPLDTRLYHLAKLRASQINQCVFCVDMHVYELKEMGETDDRLFQLVAWRESELFDARERAILAYTESATRLGDDGVPDDVWAEAARHLDEKELGALVGAVALINAFNRISVPTQNRPPIRT